MVFWYALPLSACPFTGTWDTIMAQRHFSFLFSPYALATYCAPSVDCLGMLKLGHSWDWHWVPVSFHLYLALSSALVRLYLTLSIVSWGSFCSDLLTHSLSLICSINIYLLTLIFGVECILIVPDCLTQTLPSTLNTLEGSCVPLSLMWMFSIGDESFAHTL